MGSRRVQFYLLAVLVIHASSAEKCKPSTCFSRNQDSTFKPTPGQQYTYDFESLATTQLVNKETVETSVGIRGQAIISVGENCGYTLILQNVVASGADNAKQQVKDFATHPVQFTLSGDEITPEICADSADGVFSLNVKRGIISAFQSGSKSSTEFDIFGKCPVTSSSSTNGGVTTISRQKDLDKCAYREKLVSGFWQGVVTESSDVKTSPLLNSNVESDTKFQNGVLQSTEIRETYNFLPLSTNQHGAKAKVTTKMTLKKTAAGAGVAPKNGVQRSILFGNANENPTNQKVKESIKNAYDKALKEFVKNDNRITSSAASSFADLVRLMQVAKRADLAVSYQTMKAGSLSEYQSANKALGRSLFLDALFRAGTGDSVAALVALSAKEFDEKEKQLMYLSFNLVSSVTKEAILELAKLFKDNLPKEAYLSIGSVVNKFCRDRGCETNDVKKITDAFLNKIPRDCNTKNRKEEEHLVSVLKGIRNSQTILNTVSNNILTCVNVQKPTRVRVATLQAFTANPCLKKLQQSAISVMKNKEEDSEVRIEAYLTAMECPNGNLANEVTAMMESETINQVGTFVNTHLDSIKASTDPKREAARHHFRNVRTSKKFPFDPRRYSFNREVSYAIDSLGLGSAVDTSVIYSQRSFLPRSVRLNITGNLFGNAFNMLELSARQENLESIIEHYFGPRGFFNRLSKQELYDEFMNEFSALSRAKRALPQDLAQFDKGVKLSNEFNREPDVDLSLKIFGSELYFLSMSQNVPSTPTEFLKFLAKEAQKGVDALKDFNYNFENHALWMDTAIVYPTAFGLPFKLSTTGASAVKIDLSGTIDLKAILQNPVDLKAGLNFSPSANFYVAGTLGFGAYAYESGIEVSGTVFTNTGANTTVEMQGGKNFIVKTIPTHKEQYVVDFKHQISTVSQESGREAVKVQVPFRGLDNVNDMCFDQAEFLFGAAFCLDIETTPASKPNENAPWPLYGSSHYKFKLDTADSITFRAELDFSDLEQPSLNFYHDTPHGGKERKTTLRLLSSIKSTHYFGGISVSVPWMDKQITADGKIGLFNEDALKKIYAIGAYQDQKYEYEIGFKKEGGDIVPILKLNTDLTYISGRIVERKTDQGVSYDLKQIKFGKDNYQTTIDGSFDVLEGSILGTNLRIDVSGKVVNVEGSLGYKQGNFTSELKMKSDHFPSANGKANYGFKFDEKSFGNDMLVVWDKDPNSRVNRYEFSQFADWGGENVKLKNEVNYGRVNGAAKFNGEFGAKVLSLDSSLQYQKSSADLKIDNKYSQKNPHDYETSIYAAANKKSIKLEFSRDIEGESSRVKNKIELSSGMRMELNGKISHKIDYRDADVSLQATFVPGPKKEQTKMIVTLKNTAKGHDGSLKVTTGKNEIATGESKLTYGQETKGLLKGTVKDVATVDGSFESNRGKGKGEVTAAFKDKKVRAESTFTVQKPTFDFAGTFYYDYEKDNSKKISFTTQNKIQQQSIDSKNNIEIFSERYAFNLAASNEGKLPSGKQKANVEVQLPTGRKFTATANRDVNLQDGKGNGVGHLVVTDELPNRQQRQVVVDAKMNEISVKERFFDFIGSIKYKNYDNKDMKVAVNLKNLKKGHFSTANGNLQIDGAFMPHTLTMTIKLDEYCENHAIYSFNSKYGNLGDVEASGKFYAGNKDRPSSHEFTGTLNVPNTKLQKLVVNSNGQFSEPADENGVYGIKYSGFIDYTGNKVQIDTDVNLSKTKGTATGKLQLPNQKPVGGEFKFNCNQQTSGDFAGTLTFGDNKKITSTMKVQMPDDKSLNVAATLQGDLEKFSDFSFNLDTKLPEPNQIISKINGKIDGKPYSLDYEHRASAQEPKVYFLYTCSQGNTAKFNAEAQIVSMLKGKGSITVENFKEFNLDGNVDADLSTLESFYLRGDVNCPLLHINKYAFDIHAKDAGSRTGVEYKITRDGNHVLSGTSDFTTKTEGGRTVIEGKSTIKLTDGKSDDVTFKITRKVYELARDNEAGFEGNVKINVGPRSYAGDLKLTDKEFHSKFLGCAKKGSCTNLEAKSAVQKSSIDGFTHNLEVLVDLRQVGVPHQFNMKSETARNGFKFHHNTDAALQSKDTPDYKYSLYINEKNAAASLTMPKREIALEATYNYPERFYGKYDSRVTFFIDKSKPQFKSEVGFAGEISHAGSTGIKANGELKFTHPRVNPLAVRGTFAIDADRMDMNSNLEFDVFTNPNDKIIFSGKFGNSDTSGRGFNITNDVEIYSKGLEWKLKLHEHTGLSFEQRLVTYGSEVTLPMKDWRFGAHAFISDKNFEVIGVLFNEDVVKTNAVYDLGKSDFGLESTVKYLASDPIITKASITGLTEGSFKMTKGSLLNVDGGFGLGKDIHLKVIGAGKEIFNGKVALDSAHFLNTNYKVDEAQVKAFSQTLQDQLKKDLETANADVKQKFEYIKAYGSERRDKILKALPDFSQFAQEYTTEITKLVEELKSDPNIQKFLQTITPFITEVSKYFETLLNIFSQQVEFIQTFTTQIYEDFSVIFNERILPELQKLYDSAQEFIKELVENGVKAASAAIERAAKALKIFQEDFNKISQSFKDLTGGSFETLTQYVKEIFEEVKQLYFQISEHFKSLPGIDAIKEKYTEIFGKFTPLQAVVAVLDELLSTVKAFVPEKAKPFFDKANEYLQRKLSGEDVNDLEFLKQLFSLLKDAVQAIRVDVLDKLNFDSSAPPPWSLNALNRLPPFITNIRFSALSQLTSEPIVSLKDLLYLYRPYAFNPAEAIPPFTMHGEIADGTQFFTFDGRHLTLSGGCNYILARDFAEGNFSIVANMKDGKMKSITVGDKSGWIEISSETTLKYKDKDAEFPIHDKTLHAWRNVETFQILTQFGAGVTCSVDLALCHVEVSGFYAGKTRGLMGNGNGEPYDDYTLPDGKIAESTNDLGNAYKTQKACEAPITSSAVTAKSSSNEFCSQYFGRESSLRIGFLFVNPSNYREACEQVTQGAANAQQEACKIASIYASRCRQEFIPASIPKACTQCLVGKQKVDVGDLVSVKVPQKEADIVVVFDTGLEKSLSVVTEIVTELRKDLKSQGINDLQVIAIGYNVKDRFHSFYTTKGKLDFRGRFDVLKGTGIPEDETIKTRNQEIDDFVEELKKSNLQTKEDYGISPDARAFRVALEYPFRPTATKTILAVRSTPIPYSLNPSKLAAGKFSAEVAAKAGIFIHSLMPVEITEPAEKAKNIVGFNANVAILINEKKRPNMGSVETAQKMKYTNDMGVDLTKERGYVFNLNNYNTDKKKFVGAVSYVLADIISRTEVISECKCELTNGIYPESKCEAKSTQLLAPKKAPARG